MIVDLTKEKNISKTINSLSFHNFIGFGALFFLGVVDTLFLSHYNQQDLAASIIGSPFVYTFLAVFIGFASSKQIFLSKLFKNKDANLQYLSKKITKKVEFLLFFCILLLLISLPFLLELINVEESLREKTYYYILINFIGVPFCIYNVLKQSYLRSIGNTKIPSAGMLLVTIVNMVLDPIFIFGLNLGLYGAAFATVIAWCSASCMFYFIIKREKKDNTKNKKDLTEFKKLVPSMVCNQIINPMTTFITTIFINQHTLSMINAYGVGLRLEKMLVIIGFSYATALSIYVGQNHNNEEKIKEARKTTLLSGIVLTLIASLSIWFFSDNIGDFFNLNKNGLDILSFYFLMLIIGSFFQSQYVINIALMNVLNKHNTVLKFNILKTFCLLPFSLYAFSYVFGKNGIFMALAFQHILSFILLKAYFLLTKEKKEIIIHNNIKNK